MLQLEIHNNSGTYVLDFPENGSELLYRQLINYNIAKAKWLKVVEQYNDFMCLESIIACVSVITEFFECDESKILGLEINYEDMKSGIETLSSEKPVAVINLHAALMNIIVNLDNVIRQITPRTISEANHVFEYKGESYTIPFEKAYEHLEIKTRPTLTFGQVKEVMEVKRLFTKLSAKGDPTGSYEYMEGLKVISLLALKPNEVVPHEMTEDWLAKRMHHFTDISAQIYYDVSFFLTRIGSQLKMTGNSITSLILLKNLQEQKSMQN